MTEEELREKIADWLFLHSGITRESSKKHANEFLALIREAGYLKCSECGLAISHGRVIG